MATALLFPGQGSQFVGMGRDLAADHAEARAIFAEVDDALGEHLSRTIWEGPAETLTLTANAQPALFAVSLAALRALEARHGDILGRVRVVAGHSLGEYAALAAAGVLSVAEAARLLRRRGEAMQRAVPVGEGAMAALLGAEREQADAIAAGAAAETGGICEIANDNGAGQVVISGHRRAIEHAVQQAPVLGIKRAMLLPVSAPFHCSLMAPAAAEMKAALAAVALRPARVPVVANVTAAPVVDPEAIRALLVEQVTATVRWRESMAAMVAMGIDRFVELGAGKVLSGLAKRLAPGSEVVAVGSPADVAAWAP